MSDSYYRKYYLENRDNQRMLVATYCEEKAIRDPDDPHFGWFEPYGQTPISVAEHEITNEERVIVNDSTRVIYSVTLPVAVLERNDICPQIAIIKDPLGKPGWAPYGARQAYWEVLSAFSADSAIGRAIDSVGDAIARGGVIKDAHDALVAADNADALVERTPRYNTAAGLLMSVVHPADSDIEPLVRQAIESAMSPVLPEPEAILDVEQDVPPRAIWAWRLLFGIVYGIVQDKLP